MEASSTEDYSQVQDTDIKTAKSKKVSVARTKVSKSRGFSKEIILSEETADSGLAESMDTETELAESMDTDTGLAESMGTGLAVSTDTGLAESMYMESMKTGQVTELSEPTRPGIL